MACRFPGADTPEAYWRNLVDGAESLSVLSDEELAAAGVRVEDFQHSNFVRRASVLDGIDRFDAGFFGYTGMEARLMDPQQRLFMECAWEAFEDAGHDPTAVKVPVGVFTGAKTNTYIFQIASNREVCEGLDRFQLALGNDLACMATRVSYKFDLRGPSYAIHTACSTSLVAVHLACQSLLLDECRMALAGGASINIPQRTGYRFQKGGLLSPDGSCRTFDAKAEGSNFGNGVGAVLLKRLDDALEDGDHIYAVIRGSATNNDGAAKASYTAPGIDGQTAVLLEALAVAGVDARSVSYVEAHGTATDLGDSIELLALTNAYRAETEDRGFCALGSVKTNLGHLETAAGVAGLIKTAMALERGKLPASLHFEEPNPKIDFENSPFFVNSELRDWNPADGAPRRAGVSSFGIGSTNCHMILEQPPSAVARTVEVQPQLLLLSARGEVALEDMERRLAAHLDRPEAPPLADVAFTLQTGRKPFSHRRAYVASGSEQARTILLEGDPERVFGTSDAGAARPVAFLFPGLGEHYPGMARNLYETMRPFREALDRCAELASNLGCDFLPALFPPEESSRKEREAPSLRAMLGRQGSRPQAEIDATRLAQPALFAVEYALARQWQAWGIEPEALVGYSLGEYVAACVAGVLSLEDAVRLVVGRARLIEALPAGAMIAVPEDEVGSKALAERFGLSVSGIHGPNLCVLAGEVAGVEALEAALADEGKVCRRLPSTHAYHSDMMLPAVEELVEMVRGLSLAPPKIPYLSNVTGDWIRDEDATDPEYWARHLCQAVRFAEAGRRLVGERARVLLEVGPGQGLLSNLRQLPEFREETTAGVSTLQNVFGRQPDGEYLLGALGKLWLNGLAIDWQAHHGGETRHRVPLPTYPFQRESHWIEAGGSEAAKRALASNQNAGQVTLAKQDDPADWLYRPSWRLVPRATAIPGDASGSSGRWLVFTTGSPEEEALLTALSSQLPAGAELLRALPGEAFEARDSGGFTVRPGSREDYEALWKAVGTPVPTRILHLWASPSIGTGLGEGESFEKLQDLGFYSLLFLARTLASVTHGKPVHLDVLVSQLFRVDDEEATAGLRPAKAAILGPAKVIPQEFPDLSCRALEVASGLSHENLDEVVAELLSPVEEELVALRPGGRFLPHYEPTPLPEPQETPSLLRSGGVYLLTGGLGGLGLEVASFLAREVGARLVLTARTPLPAKEEWDRRLEEASEGDSVAEKIRRLRELEGTGAEVLVLSADVTDREAMAGVFEETRQRFGALDGVFHLAGIPGGGMMQLKTRSMAEAIMAPKMMGARVLMDLIDGEAEPLSFVMLFSSIASVLGEFGQADYCGANAYLDCLASSREGGAGPVVLAANWDIWQEVGLAVETEVPDHLKAWRVEMLEKAMTPAEGLSVLHRLLGAAMPRLVVSTQDLPGRIELGKSFTGQRFMEEFQKLSGAAPATRPAVASRSAGSGGRTVPSGANLPQRVAEIWARILERDEVGLDDNFFDLGGNSLLGLQLVGEMSRGLGLEVEPIALFEAPTVRALSRQLQSELGEPEELAPTAALDPGAAIAVVSMAGRFPGANTVEGLWENLLEGRESIRFFSEQELLDAGVPRELVQDPKYVRAGALVDDIDRFDAALFGYSPREAEVMDPQHRLFLEVAWEAFERAGYDTSRYPGSVGVFAGSNLSTYLLRMYADQKVRRSVNMLQAILGNDKDSLTTAVSYKLNLRGPSVAVQTFCSTSLVAVHMAAQSLRLGECDMALAGGVRLVAPSVQGYLHEDGGIAPPDGHSRSFDAGANGSVLGNGVAAVLLKRLDDAVADNDQILAVIKGSAINNDGSLKAGYTAPSVAGQSEAVAAAYLDAGVDPATVDYVEAHGSATELGDPIEITALTKAFRRWTDERDYCAIGSVKSNLGHLDRAAGATGLIKTVMSLVHEELPPSINFQRPNPMIDFEASPFRVITERRPWKSGGDPRRAAVNSLGMGGTNVHVVLEEAPAKEPSGLSRAWQLLPVSAHTEAALEANTDLLARFFEERPEIPLADVAFTLQQGRQNLRYRRMVVAGDAADAALAFGRTEPGRLTSGFCEERERRVVFLFPGLGGQYAGMTQGLYEGEPSFRATVDHCADLLTEDLGVDLRKLLFPEAPAATSPATSAAKASGGAVDFRAMLGRGQARTEGSPEAEDLQRTLYAQPALFVVEYALAKLWMEWGVQPQAMVGYSLGEYVAACLAGVLSLEDALKLVVRRARLIEESPGGAMVAVAGSPEALEPMLGEELSISGVNGPEQTVVAGPPAALAAFEEALKAKGLESRRLQTTHAFHSKMMEPFYEPVVEMAASLELAPPELPYLSNVTGDWLGAEDATDPHYWGRHLCRPVLFGRAIETLMEDPGTIFLEIGPGQTLSSLVLQHPAAETGKPQVLGSVPHAYENQPDLAYALSTLGKLWILGQPLDGATFWGDEKRHRVLLPTYAFDRKRYWIETSDSASATAAPAAGGVAALAFEPAPTLPSEPQEPGRKLPEAGQGWWVLSGPGDPTGLGERVSRRLRDRGAESILLTAGEAHRALAPDAFEVRPDFPEDFRAVIETAGFGPQGVIVLWGLEGSGEEPTLELHLDGLAASLAAEPSAESPAAEASGSEASVGGYSPRLVLATRNSFQVGGADVLEVGRMPALAAVKSLSRSQPSWDCRIVDLGAAGPGGDEVLVREASEGAASIVAYRGRRRWRNTLEALAGVPPGSAPSTGGAVLFDGLGDRCITFTRALANRGHALVSLEPAGFPAPAEWNAWLAGDPEDGQLSRRIRRARELQGLGVDLRVVAVDRTIPGELGAGLMQAGEHLGAVRGLVYTAEPPLTEEAAEASLERCEAGFQNLEGQIEAGALPVEDLEWALLLTSPHTPAVASTDALTADLLLAARAERSASPAAIPWRCVWWDPTLEPRALTDAVDRVLAANRTQLVVSSRGLEPGWSPFSGVLGEVPAASSEPDPAGVGFYDRPELRVEFVAPRNELEESVAGAWRELLGVDRVGIHDNFLELGGDSLLASRLVTRMRQIFSVDLPIRLLFEASTVAELAVRIKELQQEDETREMEAVLAQIQGLSEEDLEREIERREMALEVED